MKLSLRSIPHEEGRGKAIPDLDELTSVVHRLNAVAKLMNRLALGIYTCTFVNFVFTFLLPMFRIKIPEVVYLVTGIVIGLAIWFDRRRRMGDELFLDISDSQHWNRRSNKEVDYDLQKLTRTEFTRACDLLLFTGKTGPGIYVVINFCLCTVTTLAGK